MSPTSFIWLCLFFNTAVFARNVRIVGGENAEITEFPYAASFRWYPTNVHFCGGAIVSQRYIVTAAHCGIDFEIRKNDVRIYVGTTSRTSTTGTVLTINNVHIDPQFSSKMSTDGMNRHDLSLVEVKEIIIFNESQNKIDLPTENVKENEIVMLSGWGVTTYPVYTFPEQLQKASMQVLNNVDCSNEVEFIVHFEQLCAYHAEGVGACVGDSGSPLVSNGKLIGISSFVQPCGIGYPDIYVRIYPYKNFIESIIF